MAHRMECDWEFEIAPDAPIIDAAWAGFVDLRSDPSRIIAIDEAAQYPALAHALTRLNANSSPVWTAKCDVWKVEEFDLDELDADALNAQAALGCYIDLLPSDPGPICTLEGSANWCRQLCLILRRQPLRRCRVDIVVRRAFFTSDLDGLGATAYVTACCQTEAGATEVLSRALAALTDSVLAVLPMEADTPKYNESIPGE